MQQEMQQRVLCLSFCLPELSVVLVVDDGVEGCDGRDLVLLGGLSWDFHDHRHHRGDGWIGVHGDVMPRRDPAREGGVRVSVQELTRKRWETADEMKTKE